MSRATPQDLTHVHFMLAELEAELVALEARSEAAQALAQLDAREAAGEPLTVICGTALRASLVREIEQSPVTKGRSKLAELRLLIEHQGSELQPLAAVNPVSAASGDNVADLAAYRAKAAGTTRSRRRTLAVAGRGVAMAVALTITGAAAGLSWLPAFGRAPIVDLAIGVPDAGVTITRAVVADIF